ncbi:polyprenyl synthetase family protein, partial [Halorubrum sp. SD626R]
MTSETKEARVLDAIRERRDLVNAAIDEELPVEEPKRLYEATRYILEAGGKRLRPTVATLAAEAVTGVEPLSTEFREFPALDGRPVDVMRAAVAIE